MDSPMTGRGLRLDAEIWNRLDQAAQADRRSTSSLVRKILADWLDTHHKTGR